MITLIALGATISYLLLDKYLPLLVANKARPSRSLFGWRMRTDP